MWIFEYILNLYKEYTSLKSKVPIAVVCLALLVRVTLTDANV